MSILLNINLNLNFLILTKQNNLPSPCMLFHITYTYSNFSWIQNNLPYSRRLLINIFNKSFIYLFSKHLPSCTFALPSPYFETSTAKTNVRISVPFNSKILPPFNARIPREIMREYYKERRSSPPPSSPFSRENNRNGRSRGGSSSSSCVLVSIDHASLPPDNFHLSLFVDKNLATRSFRVSKTLETEKSSAKKRREKEK